MNKQDITKLVAESERVRLECKKARSNIPNSMHIENKNERSLDPKKDPKKLTKRQGNILNSIKTNKSLTRVQLAQRLDMFHCIY